ncbi:MAG: hypothetical protein KME28_22105 [Pelatocladus maniniholoensis HA4357-MV3]|jgi:hypothetical protein|uniref:Uncharacterized protein n=1 Tax=Pelatocladus maniniholoensis HA4357-MV3 TaxID=1117104 RepID=A0A9E3HBZ6_9NOST|nr:hypothetical protein [Pelatocladus maniniholoensis HA4357-MV3]
MLDTNLAESSFAVFILLVLGTVGIIWEQKLSSLLKSRFNNAFGLVKTDKSLCFKPPSFWLIRARKLLLIAISTFYMVNRLSAPAKAQFFQDAETWMNSNFQGTGEAIPLVFNTLRGLFLLYLGISLVKIIQAARQEEDWQNLARTPMIIVVAVTVGDILTQLIIGTGGTTTTGGT